MLKGNRKYIFFLAICFALLVLLQILTPKAINWNLSYSGDEKIPYGTYALHSILPDIFPKQKISDKKSPLYNTLYKNNYTNTNYIIINQTFNSDSLDTRELLHFIEKGNTAFIAANYFTGKFADKLKIKTENFGLASTLNIEEDSLDLSKVLYRSDTAILHFTSPFLHAQKKYIYSKGIENTFFSSFDTSNVTALGLNQKQQINFIKLSFGKGTLFLSTVPEVFSNYHFVSVNHDYVYAALSYLPNQQTLWDEYYKVSNIQTDTPFRILFKNEALLMGYYLTILSLLLFMLIGIKRKQRFIPILEPLKNTTLQFVDVVGTLYYQTGNHKNIAEKKINYFLEYIRTNFQIKTTLYDDLFISRISNLSGIERQKIHDMFYYFSDISIKTSITQEELLKLNKMIEIFHKESKR